VKHLLQPLPPYSPQLNPVESLWSKWKAYIKHNEKPDKTALLKLIEEGALTITPQDAMGWYHEVTRHYATCIDNKGFLAIDP